MGFHAQPFSSSLQIGIGPSRLSLMEHFQANLKLLQEIQHNSNNFSSVPHGAFSGLNRLQILSLDDNPHLNPWAFPAELSDSTILLGFYSKNTNLIGSIPDIFDSLKSLQNLRLSNNNLTGPIPNSLQKTEMEF
ncbi:unnamed protein product [Amaranthus hypochondriacus]